MTASERTKKFICDAFKELCKQKPYSKVNVKDIIAKCEMSKATFYYHFRDKQDVVNYIFYNDIVVPTHDMISAGNVPEWTHIIEFSLKKMLNDRHLYIPAMRDTGQNNLEEYSLSQTIDCWMHMSTKLFADKEKPCEKSAALIEYLYEFFARGEHSSVIKWVRGGMKEPPEVISFLINYCSVGVANLAMFIAEEDTLANSDIPIDQFYSKVTSRSDIIRRKAASKNGSDLITSYIHSSDNAYP